MIEPEYMGKGVALPILDEREGVDKWATGQCGGKGVSTWT